MDSDKIYINLRSQILNLELVPATDLNLKALTNQFEVSRSPVRDALNRLANEGLVTIIPQSGTKVSKIHLKTIKEEQFLRTSLELSALSLFLSTENTASIATMESLIKQQTTAFEIRDMKFFLALDNDFHREIFKGADKENCYDLILSHSGNYQRIRRLSFAFDSISESVLSEHLALTKAIKDNDKEKAKAIDFKHINKLDNEITIFKKNLNTYFA